MDQITQRKLLTNLCNDIRDSLLKHSEEWSEEWDGRELRWLLEKAVSYEVGRSDGRTKRYRDFNNEWITRNLY